MAKFSASCWNFRLGDLATVTNASEAAIHRTTDTAAGDLLPPRARTSSEEKKKKKKKQYKVFITTMNVCVTDLENTFGFKVDLLIIWYVLWRPHF